MFANDHISSNFIKWDNFHVMKTLFLLMTILLFAFYSNAQNVFEEKYTMAGGFADAPAMCRTPEGGYAIAGTTFNSGNGMIIRIDSSGNLIWKKQYNAGSAQDGFVDIISTNDHGFALCGVTYSFFSNGYAKIWVIKTDSIGNLSWSKIMGSSMQSFIAYSIKETIDSDFAIFGSTNAGSPPQLSFLACLDNSGNQLWSRTYSELEQGGLGEVVSCRDKGLLFTEGIRNYGSKTFAYVVKTDSLGNIQYGRRIWTDTSSLGNDFGMALRETSDNGFLVAGLAFDQDLFLVRFASTGNILWTKKIGFGFPIGAVSFDTARNHGFVLALNSSQPNVGGYLVTIDSLGNVVWAKKYGTPDVQFKKVICLPNTLGFAVCGIADSGANHSIYFMRTDTAGRTTCDQNVSCFSTSIAKTIDTLEIMYPGLPDSAVTVQVSNILVSTQTLCGNGIVQYNNEVDFSIFPNPANDFLTIQLENLNEKNIQIKIINVFGQVVIDKKVDPSTGSVSSGNFEKQIDVSGLSDGIYFIAITVGEKQFSEKFIKE